MSKVFSLEAIHRDYASKGVKFYYIYKALAHPERNGYITPFTLGERLMHVQEAKTKLGTQIDWLCDTMSNDLKHALGNAPNSEFVIDPNGIIASRRAWSDPDELRRFLEKTVGPVDNPTRASDLKMNVDLGPASNESPTGIVPRLPLPGRMIPLKIQPLIENKETPFYVKLRAEADANLLREKSGQLYLGFFLDRIYAVHWNNLTKPLEFEIKTPEGVQVTPSQGVGLKVEAPADKDPREFLVDVAADSFEKPLQLTVRYFACDDANTFCIPVTEHYTIQIERDPDGGARRGRGMPGHPGDFIARLMQRDRDGDGKLAAKRLPSRCGGASLRSTQTKTASLTMRNCKMRRSASPTAPIGVKIAACN